MPHLIVEATGQTIEALPNGELMQKLHATALATDLFDEKSIKVRVRPYETALIAGKPDDFVHVTIYLIDGRDKATKKRLALKVHDEVRALCPSCASVSVDVRDLDREVYTKSQQ